MNEGKVEAVMLNENASVQSQPLSKDELLAKIDREVAQFVIKDATSDAIRFTPSGLKEYRARFAKAGIDIRNIKTHAAFKDACRASNGVWVEELRALVKGHPVLEQLVEDGLSGKLSPPA
jgi:hypothetical protein